ncbi:MAG TPA: dolichyl-phosphate beta-glucosyltransferase [Gemmatimonadales bacterium]|jgi:glycosyltransferase involved in cell wall biosynthesis
MSASPVSAARMRTVDIMIPVLNEAHVLEKSVNTLRAFCRAELPWHWRVVVVDNGSTDGTQEVAQRLKDQFPDEVDFYHLDQRGRGRALRYAWGRSTADVCTYMDVDLSTELPALRRIVDPILAGKADLATGSRLHKGLSRVTRSLKRYILSKSYNIMVRTILNTRVRDHQCGFKAASRQVIEHVVPQVQDQTWFFDTELLVLSEKQGYRLAEVPIHWVEDQDSRVKIAKTAFDDIMGILRVRWLLWQWMLGRGDPPRRMVGEKTA